MASTHLIETDSALFLIDAGFFGHASTILRAIRRLGRQPQELRLVLITHAHLDHFGGLAGLSDAVAFETACHPDHVCTVERGGLLVSPAVRLGWEHYVQLARHTMGWLPVRGTGPVIPLKDGTDLSAWGLPGRVVHTPGHSAGCLSVLLDDGTALVGDLVQGKRLPTLVPELPAMAEDTTRAYASWERLLAMGATRFLPAHAGEFTAGELLATLRRDGIAAA
ncbi:MAG: MBL fold metallo-hydrolase [Coriobacteriia bacterium]|nr:MBL fold metallo-hydrolase [Coriobacteriia bacterium]